MGAPDNAWGLRPEHLLNGAILRLDTDASSARRPRARREDRQRRHLQPVRRRRTADDLRHRRAQRVRPGLDQRRPAVRADQRLGRRRQHARHAAAPYSFGADQRIDFATNGAYTGPDVPALTNVTQTQNDYLFNIVQGGYYGHPNPTARRVRPQRRQPDQRHRPQRGRRVPRRHAARPQLPRRTGATILRQELLARRHDRVPGHRVRRGAQRQAARRRYSGGDDIVVLTPRRQRQHHPAPDRHRRPDHFVDPLDLAEEPATGFLYVAEYGGQKITLVRPITPGANIATDKTQMVFNDTTASGASQPAEDHDHQHRHPPLAFPPDGFTITGTDARSFNITQKPTLPATIAPGATTGSLIEIFHFLYSYCATT